MTRGALTGCDYRCDGVRMDVRILLTVWLAALLLAPSAHAGDEPGPWFGTWQLNQARSSRRSADSPYKQVTTRIEPAGDGLKVTYDMVGTRGGVTHMEWTGRFDGKDYPVQGVDYVLTNAYRHIDERRYEVTVKVDGSPAATAVAAVSNDGQTLTVVTTERDSRGKRTTTTAIYDRK